MEGGKAVVQAAESLQSPIIIQVHGSVLNYAQEPFLQLLSAFRYYAQVPVYLQLDHCSDEQMIYKALQMRSSQFTTSSFNSTRGGSSSDSIYPIYSNDRSQNLFDCIMIDGSHLPYESNLEWTAKMVRTIS